MNEIRLIDANALKIEIEKQIAYCDDKSKHQSDMEEVLRYSNTSYGLRLAHNYIDNATTVTPSEIQAIMSDYLIYRKEERPKGEWVENIERRGCFAGDRTVYSYTCPFCKVKEFKKYPFCHCGADMRGDINA